MFTATLLSLLALTSALSETSGEFSANYVVRYKGDDPRLIGTYYALAGFDEIKSYIDEYNKVNDGTNLTKALVMFSRIMNGGMEYPGQNEVNSTAARVGAEYAALDNITLDCHTDTLNTSDRELCESILKSTPEEPNRCWIDFDE